MQLVLDAPMRAHQLEQPLRRQDRRQGHIAHRVLHLAAADPFGLDAGECRQSRKRRRIGRRRQHAGTAPFLAIVRLLGGLKERKEALGVSLLECAHRRRMERAVVALQAQRIIGTAGQHTFGHPRMTMKGIGRDDAAFQDQGLQQCQGGSDLIAARSPRGRYRYAGLGIPDTHHQRRRTGTTAFIGLAQGLPIHRDDPRGAPRSKPSRIAPTKLASALASSAGSSRRNTRLKQSWLGAPCGNSTISASSAALTAPKSAMWTQLFWPHNVAASAMNRMADSSWRAFGARGSRTSRKIDNTGCIEGLPNQETPQNRLSSRWQQPLFTNAIPLRLYPRAIAYKQRVR